MMCFHRIIKNRRDSMFHVCIHGWCIYACQNSKLTKTRNETQNERNMYLLKKREDEKKILPQYSYSHSHHRNQTDDGLMDIQIHNSISHSIYMILILSILIIIHLSICLIFST